MSQPSQQNATSTIKQTTCAYCGVGCGVEAKVDEKTRSIEVIGCGDHPSNFGRLCSKGSALDQTIGLPEGGEFGHRLLSPYIDGKQANWDNALDKVANGFKDIIEKHGKDSVAFYVSGQLLTEDYYVANKLMKGFIGSANIDTNSRLCMSSSVSGHKRAFGTDTVPGCYEDFENADLITLVGSNTAWCHPVLFQRIKAYKEANPNVKLVVIDPRRTQTCDIADLHLPLKPGTDVNLFNGLFSYLADNQKLDQSFIDSHSENFEEALNTAKRTGSLSDIAKQLNIKESLLNKFYGLFGDTEKAVTLYSQGVNQSTAGTDKVNSILNCHLATGRIGKTGMGPFSMTGQPNAMGGREVGGMANTLAAHMDFHDDNIDRVNRFWSTDNLTADVPTGFGLTAVNLFNAIDSGKVKAVWVMATNPVVSLPNADLVKRALDKCELVVVSDCIANTDTGQHADVLLPATGWSEKNGTVTNSERRISRQRSLLAPAGEAKHDWWTITEVAKRMGYAEAFPYESQADIFREHAALSGFENNESGRLRDFDISAWANISDDEYDDLAPTQWPVNAEHPNGRQRFFADGLFYTQSRKAQFIATEPRAPKNAPSAEFPFVLNSGRIRDQWHTMTRTSLSARLNQHIAEPFVEIHPDDTKAQGLKDQQIVQVESRWGKMLGRLNVTDEQQTGSLFAPMHWTGILSKNGRVNPVVNPEIDPVSMQPESKHTPVDIKAFEAKWHGFVLTRNNIQWPQVYDVTVDYVVQIGGDEYTRYELAHSTALSNPESQIREWLHTDDSQQVMTYDDAGSGIFRMALFTADGKLDAVVFIGPTEELPDRTWLTSLFKQDEINERSRAALLSGYAPAGEDMGRIVCACFSVGENTIKQAIAEHGLTSAADIGKHLKAGTNCGSCVPEIKEILSSFDVKADKAKVAELASEA